MGGDGQRSSPAASSLRVAPYPRSAKVEAESNRITVLIAFGACFAYAAIVLTGQAATPLIGETETMWIGRWSGLVFIAVVLLVQRASDSHPAAWLPYVGLQGGARHARLFRFSGRAPTRLRHTSPWSSRPPSAS